MLVTTDLKKIILFLSCTKMIFILNLHYPTIPDIDYVNLYLISIILL